MTCFALSIIWNVSFWIISIVFLIASLAQGQLEQFVGASSVIPVWPLLARFSVNTALCFQNSFHMFSDWQAAQLFDN